ncbi:major facilitator superfamily domain-containing protein [Dunaliella salina]|uniref:Major facilitator superfamily domain-containing protein n=1 Tax=Dunaliella salina TaxID=3046 RepID=A0ABQ7GH99_DUNSA|nr:major facilitator superfamily domain-containing protein [Dunaliella salina]|eukprot:KAF5833983.1 major facilitator superfamily domain-containing protein [Dunaliella salina]
MLVLCLGASTVLRSMMWASGQLGQVVVLLILAEFIAAPVGPFIDSHVQHAAKQESDYGKQRLWASAGWGITAPLAGSMVQRYGLGIGFLCYTALSIPSLIAATLLRASPTPLNVQEHQQHQHRIGAERAKPGISAAPDTARKASTWEGMRQLRGSVPVWQLLLQCTASGIGGGVIGTYLFLFARDIGALPSLLGLLLMANCAAEVPMFYFQERIMKIISPQAMLNAALGAMVLRLALYAAAGQVANPWLILPIELLQGFTMAMAWSGACVSSKRLAPKGLEATMQGVVTATMAGLGGGFGGLLGGVLRDHQFGWSSIWGVSAGVVTSFWLMSAALPQVAQVLQARVRKQHAE